MSVQQNSLYEAKFWKAYNSSVSDCIMCIQKDVIDCHSVLHKLVGKEI